MDDSELGKKLRPFLPMLKTLHIQLQDAVTKFGEGLDCVFKRLDDPPPVQAEPISTKLCCSEELPERKQETER